MSNPPQYLALALQPAFNFVRDRSEIMANIERMAGVMAAGIWLASSQIPVRLVALPEGVLQGFWDELTDMRHSDYHDKIAIDVPGPETEAIGALARQHDTYIIFQARAKDPDFPGYYFNKAYIIDPQGEVIHQYTKLQTFFKEPSTTPIDVYDRWTEIHGWTLDSLFPVADTEIGRIGTMICYDGAFPEIARGLAINGAEILYRCSYGEPFASRGDWELQNRSRALDNACYVIAPNIGPANVMPGIDYPVSLGGRSMIVDPTGMVLSETQSSTTTIAGSKIDIAGLREHRAQAHTIPTLKEISAEQYRVIYEQSIREKNFYASDPNKHHADREIERQKAGAKFVERGVWPESETLSGEVRTP